MERKEERMEVLRFMAAVAVGVLGVVAYRVWIDDRRRRAQAATVSPEQLLAELSTSWVRLAWIVKDLEEVRILLLMARGQFAPDVVGGEPDLGFVRALLDRIDEDVHLLELKARAAQDEAEPELVAS
jgi:hypothetical protein